MFCSFKMALAKLKHFPPTKKCMQTTTGLVDQKVQNQREKKSTSYLFSSLGLGCITNVSANDAKWLGIAVTSAYSSGGL